MKRVADFGTNHRAVQREKVSGDPLIGPGGFTRLQDPFRLSPGAIGTALEILSSFGDGGRQPGQFFAVHSAIRGLSGRESERAFTCERSYLLTYFANAFGPTSAP
jgi:hypothetical protein